MTPRPSPQRPRFPTLGCTVLALVILCVVASLTLAVVETLTSAKPISLFFARTLGGYTPPATAVSILSTPPATYTPTLTPIRSATPTLPPTATPAASATPTPAPSSTPTALPSPTPVVDTPTPTTAPSETPTIAATATPAATVTPTATATSSPTSTPTATTTSTPTVETTATSTPTQAPTRPPTATPRPATATPRPTATPALSGRVAFPAYNSGSGVYDIFLANIDGSGAIRFLSAASQPAIGPNGDLLAFRNWQSDQRGVAAIALDGGGYERRSEFIEDAAPTWAANGHDIVFFSRRDNDRQPRIYLTALHSSGDVALLQNNVAIFGIMPYWLADGRIAYRATYPTQGVAVMNGDGGNIQILSEDDRAGSLSGSPNGRLLAFMSERDGNWEIYRIGVDGEGLQRLTNNAANDGLPAWSPDGRSIAFASDRGGPWALWVMNADGSGQRQLFSLPGPLGPRPTGEADFVWNGWWEERITWGP